MKLVSSYAVEIKHFNKIFIQTIEIFKDAVTFCIKAFEESWEELKDLKIGNREQFAYADNLIHTTKSYIAKYPEFDIKFHKIPSFLRHSVINTALGYLNSYHSNLERWEEDSVGKAPLLQPHQNKLPTFYKNNMYIADLDRNVVKLKLFVNNDWNWVEVQLKHTDVVNIKKHMQNTKMSAPTLERRNKKWFLRFAFEEQVKINKTPLKNQRILAVNLGNNTDATCSVMNVEGAILARKFVNFASDKDHLHHTVNKIKKIKQKYGSHNTTKLWRCATFYNNDLAIKITKEIVNIAKDYQCDVIVFEHLNTMQASLYARGKSKYRLNFLKKKAIQRMVEHKAHQNGIRISTVCGYGSASTLAYDGSGKVRKDKAKLCRFTTGKKYNRELSASYNIGARYFIKEMYKNLPVKVWSDIVAKVPECQKRTRCTYSTLVMINKIA